MPKVPKSKPRTHLRVTVENGYVVECNRADSYCRDAAVAVETAKQYMAKRQGSAMAARA